MKGILLKIKTATILHIYILCGISRMEFNLINLQANTKFSLEEIIVFFSAFTPILNPWTYLHPVFMTVIKVK